MISKCIQLHQNVFRNKLALITYIILDFDHCENRLTPFNIRKKNLASFPFWNFACSKGLRRRSTKAGIFRKECNKSCQLIQSGEGVRVLNSISVGETFFPLHFCESLDTFLGQVKKLSKSMECVWWDCKSEKWEKEGRVMNICLFFSFSCHFHLSCFWYFCLFEPWN